MGGRRDRGKDGGTPRIGLGTIRGRGRDGEGGGGGEGGEERDGGTGGRREREKVQPRHSKACHRLLSYLQGSRGGFPGSARPLQAGPGERAAGARHGNSPAPGRGVLKNVLKCLQCRNACSIEMLAVCFGHGNSPAPGSGVLEIRNSRGYGNVVLKCLQYRNACSLYRARKQSRSRPG